MQVCYATNEGDGPVSRLRQSLAEVRILSHVDSFGICGGYSTMGRVSSGCSVAFPCQYHSNNPSSVSTMLYNLVTDSVVT